MFTIAFTENGIAYTISRSKLCKSTGT